MRFPGRYRIKKIIRFFVKPISNGKRAIRSFKIRAIIDFLSFGFIPFNKFQKNRPLVTFVVLGMHRTSTSMLSRALHNSGESWMGDDIMLRAKGNPRGLYEQKSLVQLNDRMLSAAGGTWDNPPSRECILKLIGQFDHEMKDLLKQLSNTSIGGSIGLKDPRMCLLIELWEPFLRNPQYIISFRKIDSIAKSLNLRDGMPVDLAMNLAKEYNHRILDFVSSRF